MQREGFLHVGASGISVLSAFSQQPLVGVRRTLGLRAGCVFDEGHLELNACHPHGVGSAINFRLRYLIVVSTMKLKNKTKQKPLWGQGTVMNSVRLQEVSGVGREHPD